MHDERRDSRHEYVGQYSEATFGMLGLAGIVSFCFVTVVVFPPLIFLYVPIAILNLAAKLSERADRRAAQRLTEPAAHHEPLPPLFQVNPDWSPF